MVVQSYSGLLWIMQWANLKAESPPPPSQLEPASYGWKCWLQPVTCWSQHNFLFAWQQQEVNAKFRQVQVNVGSLYWLCSECVSSYMSGCCMAGPLRWVSTDVPSCDLWLFTPDHRVPSLHPSPIWVCLFHERFWMLPIKGLEQWLNWNWRNKSDVH